MRILSIVGARPQFVKAATVSRAISEKKRLNPSIFISEEIIHTGQHFDYGMSQVFFEKLKMPEPAVNLGVNSFSHGEMTGRMMIGLEKVFLERKPDWVLVFGDTNSTMAAALAATKLYIPVAHVEAGLRSFNKMMPEEINRVVTDHVADLLLCPTLTAVKNLNNEGLTDNVHRVGDVMYDSALYFMQTAEKDSQILDELALESGKYCLATVHRAENINNPPNLASILKALEEIAKNDCPIILPLHPGTRSKIEASGRILKHIQVIEPVDYLDMLMLEKHARMIFTDSGGVQKEAYWCGVPCVTMREETEWVETVDTGWNQLVGADKVKILDAFHTAEKGGDQQDAYGDGQAAEKILEMMVSNLELINSQSV